MQKQLLNIQEDTSIKKSELMLPSFSLDVTHHDTIVGMKTQDNKYVKKSSSRVVLAIAGG